MSPTLHITITPGDDAPLYRQIVRQVREAIAQGRIGTGDRLPSHRELAKRLVVAPLTVKKAYDELEREGLIRTARGQGTFVAGEAPEVGREARLESLRKTVRLLAHEAHLAGVEEEDLVRLLAEERALLDVQRDGSEPGKETS